MTMAKWMKASECVPDHQEMVEIAWFERDNNPPYWLLSHAWYWQGDGASILPRWVRKGGQIWPVEFWRESTNALMEERPWE